MISPPRRCAWRTALATLALAAGACGTTTGADPEISAAEQTASSGEPIASALRAVETRAPETTDSAVRATSDSMQQRLSLDLASGKTMAELLTAEQVPGVAIAVVRDGQIVYAEAFGVDPRTQSPLVDDAIFQVGSISKPVTAMGAAWLGQARALFWDADIDNVLTSFELERGPVARDDPITVERLLAHRGGINVDGFLGYGPGQEVPTLGAVLRGNGNSSRIRANRPVGGEYWYSGGGYVLLEQVMIDATGKPFIELMDEIILGPAGMVDSTFRSPLPQSLRGRETAPSINGEAIAARSYPEHAAAGLWSTAPDLARLLITYQAALNGADDTLLEQSWAERLIQFSTTADLGLVVGHGWFLDRPDDPRWFWHSGTNVGYNAEIIGSVDGRHGAVVLSNALDATPVIADIFATIGELEGWVGAPR